MGDELKLNRADVGWYQVRKALEARNASGDYPTVSLKAFLETYKGLTEKLQPMVYELGFLKGQNRVGNECFGNFFSNLAILF